mgnify:CR=1 FL=1
MLGRQHKVHIRKIVPHEGAGPCDSCFVGTVVPTGCPTIGAAIATAPAIAISWLGLKSLTAL